MQKSISESDGCRCNRYNRQTWHLPYDRHTLVACLLLITLALAGCFRGDSSSGGGAKNPNSGGEVSNSHADFDADQTVAKMRDVYRSAAAYSDQGRFRVQLLDGDTLRENSAPFSTLFERPGRLALNAQELQVVCDGEQLRAVIVDEATNNYDGQMLQRDISEPLTLHDLYVDAGMSNILRGELFDGTPWPLRLLLDDPALESWLAGGAKALGTESLDGKTYRLVQVENQGQTATLWIDPNTHLLRRVELPLLDEHIGLKSPIAEYAGAKIVAAGQFEAAKFRLDPPRRAKFVRYFVPPVVDELPSPRFGKAVDDFKLEAADGEVVTRDSLAGDVVLLAWFLDNPESAVALGQLQAVAKQYADNANVKCYAVSPAPEMVTSESIARALQGFNIELPLLRDTRVTGRDVFDVHGAPTIVVLDGEHRIQAYEAGARRGLDTYLNELVAHLLKGEDPAGDQRRQMARATDMYRRNLAAASADRESKVVQLPATHIALAHGPSKLKLIKVWTRDDIASPGNLLVVPGDDGQPRIFVHEHGKDWRTIVELNARGEIVKRRQLPVPDTAAIALLRTAVDGDGRRWFAGSARSGQRVYVFNENWELAFAYPPEEERHDGVEDFALVDFQGDGTLQLVVGFWGVLGLHGVDMQGERLWSNRAAAPVVSLAVSPRNDAGWRRVLATTDRGQIVPVNGFGNDDPPQRLPNQTITHLFARADDSERLSPYIGLTVEPDGTTVALTMNDDFELPDWKLPLPAATHQNQIQWITSGQLLPGRVAQWVFALADGTIGIVSDDQSFFDSFTLGEEPTGLAVASFDGKRVLIVATKDTVTAYEVDAIK